MKKYQLVENFLGYVSKPDPTNIKPENLVSPSQNILINDAKRIEIRGGYTLDGEEDSSNQPIRGAYSWLSQRGGERHVRQYDDQFEARFVKADDSIVYAAILGGWSDTSYPKSFAPWWDNTENLEVLLFVTGNSNVYEWGGGMAEVSSVTTATITKKGTTTWAQEGFYVIGNKTILIGGVVYTYTGGESTTTLTGVTPDPSAGGVVDGDIATQQVRTRTDEPAASLQNDFIAVVNNHLFVGSEITNEINVSQNDDYTDYAFSSPRVPGEGALLTLDSKGRGFGVLQKNMVIFAGESDIYHAVFQEITVSTTLAETINVKKLKNGPKQGARSHNLITNYADSIVYVSNEPALRILETGVDIDTPSLRSLSDPIKPDFDDENFANGVAQYHKNRIYISAPANAKVYILQIDEDEKGSSKFFWQPPQILPFRHFAVIDENLYGHSSQVPETYRAFYGTDDDNLPFTAKAALAYRNYGDRANLKNLDEWFTEGYITSNTVITVTYNFDFGGATAQVVREIEGDDQDLIQESIESAALGDNPIGDAPLGDTPNEATQLPKFRIIHTIEPMDFHEIQVIFETTSQDAQWQILATGGNARFARKIQTSIKR